MAQMNTGRIVLGGLVAGVVMNVIDFVTNGVVLGAQWKAETNALNPNLMTAGQMNGMIGWIVTDFIAGLFLTWLYAAIRPRFGPGPRTAAIAGVAAWLFMAPFSSSYAFMGLFSMSLVGTMLVGSLVSAVAGACVGGLLYTE